MRNLCNACEAIAKILESRGFKPKTIEKYKRYWNKLTQYMKEREITEYTPQIGLEFLSYFYGINLSDPLDREKNWIVRSVKYLNDYLEFSTVFLSVTHTSNVSSLKKFYGVLNDFKEYRRIKYNISATTLSSYDKYIGKFLSYLESNNIDDISLITAANIHDCCKIIVKESEGVAHNMSCSLRVFLRYLHRNNITNDDLSVKIPQFTYNRKSKLPSVLNADEINALIGSIDRANGTGKRDYAIILLACRLGLRSGDIRSLRFSDIHWERSTIEIVTQKTKQSLVLPLLEDVGQAIIEYIKFARPVTDNPVIFLTHNAPINHLSAPAISNIVKKHAGKANINISPGKRPGPHLLRNTLASVLLKKNVPLPEISGILAHSKTETTQEYYLRIDIDQLKRCVVEPPPFSWEPVGEVF